MVRRPQETIGLIFRGHMEITNSTAYVWHQQMYPYTKEKERCSHLFIIYKKM